MTDSEKLLLLADWHDINNKRTGNKNNEIQRDLRRIASKLKELEDKLKELESRSEDRLQIIRALEEVIRNREYELDGAVNRLKELEKSDQEALAKAWEEGMAAMWNELQKHPYSSAVPNPKNPYTKDL